MSFSTRTGGDNSEGSEILYECDSGYQLDAIGSVRVILVCQEDGKWSISTPQCRREYIYVSRLVMRGWYGVSDWTLIIWHTATEIIILAGQSSSYYTDSATQPETQDSGSSGVFTNRCITQSQLKSRHRYFCLKVAKPQGKHVKYDYCLWHPSWQLVILVW